MSWITSVPGMFITLAALAGALAALHKLVWKPIKGVFTKWNSAMDTLVGYPAVTDPGSGTILKPATPPLAKRVESVEQAVVMLTQIDKTLTEHISWSEEWTASVNERLSILEKENKLIND
jgi:hypothetical protein